MSADAARNASRVPPMPAGLELRPFRAFRYDAAAVQAGEAAVSFNSFSAAPVNRPSTYAEAAATLEAWITDGVLREDETAALYVYEQLLPSGRRVRGLLGGLGLSPATAGIVLPHEDTRAGPVADRLALMTATGADLEPIFVVYDGGPVAERAMAAALADARVLELTTQGGVRHRLARIEPAATLDAIAGELLPRRALIADGHHRYASYLRRQAAHWAAGDGPGPWDFGLALLVDAAEDGLEVRAIHRVLENLPLATAVERAERVARVTPLADLDLPSTAAWLDRLEAATQEDCARHRPAFVLSAGSQAFLVDGFDVNAIAASLPAWGGPALRGLNVTVLAHYLLPQVLGVSEHEGREVGDPHQAATLAEATGGTAILLPPVSFHDVLRVAAEGDTMPRKSTLFLPKPVSGLTLRRLHDHADGRRVSDATSTS